MTNKTLNEEQLAFRKWVRQGLKKGFIQEIDAQMRKQYYAESR